MFKKFILKLLKKNKNYYKIKAFKENQFSKNVKKCKNLYTLKIFIFLYFTLISILLFLELKDMFVVSLNINLM